MYQNHQRLFISVCLGLSHTKLINLEMQGIFWSSPRDAEALQGTWRPLEWGLDGLSRATWRAHKRDQPILGRQESWKKWGHWGWRMVRIGRCRCWGCGRIEVAKTHVPQEIYICKSPRRRQTCLWRMKSSPWLQSSAGDYLRGEDMEGEAGAAAAARQEGQFTV